MAASLDRYDRFACGTQRVGWVFGYANRARRGRSHALATGIEIGVQLAGDWTQRAARTGTRVYRPGDCHVLWPGESYANEYSARAGEGLQVGFILYPEEVTSLVSEGAVLAPDRQHLAPDRRLMELCRSIVEHVDRGATLPAREIVADIIGYIAANSRLEPVDPVLAAKQALDRTFSQPRYMEEFGDIAGMHPATFARRFRARFGLTPAHYRVLLRLNEAARRCWSRREQAIADIAHDVGFDDISYFHRAFRRHFKMTPAAYRNRGLVVIA